MTLHSRRSVLAAASVSLAVTLHTVRAAWSRSAAAMPRIGLCTFSCHQHWKAVRDGTPGTKFTNTSGFVDYALSLGGQGVQTSVSSLTDEQIAALRTQLESAGAYYEGDVRLPEIDESVDEFADQVRRSRLAGAAVARTVLLSGRRYETFRTLADFDRFHRDCRRRIQRVEPVLKRQGLKLAVENHKDLTTDEFLNVLSQCDREWIGVNVDTGNNLALLEEPHAVIESLAPYVRSVHLKDMAVQPDSRGFLLSEVPLGTGLLDLPRVLKTLAEANPEVCFSLEMATRDPLVVPCLTEVFWNTMPDRRATHLDRAMQFVADHPPKQTPPQTTGRPMIQVIANEETNNLASLEWYRGR